MKAEKNVSFINNDNQDCSIITNNNTTSTFRTNEEELNSNCFSSSTSKDVLEKETNNLIQNETRSFILEHEKIEEDTKISMVPSKVTTISDMCSTPSSLPSSSSSLRKMQLNNNKDTSSYKLPQQKSKNCPINNSSLTTDLLQYFENTLPQDVEIVCQNKTFWCNRILLSARSPVFDCMLRPLNSFTEGKSQRVEIHEAKPTIVEAYLDFIRTDNCPLLIAATKSKETKNQHDNTNCTVNDITEELLQLYNLADRYETISLMRRCSTLICKRINRKNVLNIFSRIEDVVGSDTIRLKCMECFHSISGADLLSMIRGVDIWNSLRTMPIEIKKLSNPADIKKHSTSSFFSFELMCSPHDSIASIKERLIKLSNTNNSYDGRHIKLLYSGTLLENSKTLSNYGISASSTILVIDPYNKTSSSQIPSTSSKTNTTTTLNNNNNIMNRENLLNDIISTTRNLSVE